MKKTPYLLILISIFISSYTHAQETFSISLERLKDKIKGGWAGQTIGVTYGAPIEFRYQGTMVNDYQKIKWYDGLLKKTMIEDPGVYDDLYMDITFVEVFEKEGINAPASSHANAVANANYMLWHANQAARYNILNGIPAPQCGYWTNNPHADCIDFQIEADFAGLMSPQMPNSASQICDKIGHIMNYGDGWYGGVYVSAMYSLAFGSNDIHYIVNEALKTIPKNTKYYNCISDVIKWQKQYPTDWKKTWFEIQKKWTDDIGCPGGVFNQFNIDATVNSAYVVMGLLYGNGDYSKTLEIATRAGQDADCNPSTAGGILGTMLGYDKIPANWKIGLHEIEDIPFKYTHTSLNKLYVLSYQQALECIKANGGSINETAAAIKRQTPSPVRVEESFPNMHPTEKSWFNKELINEYTFEFTGTGFVINGDYRAKPGTNYDSNTKETAVVELYVDGIKSETIKLPLSFTTRRHEIAWKYQLENKAHRITLKLLNPNPTISCFLSDAIFYQ
jgi:ADP-ribosylglycohydrolase